MKITSNVRSPNPPWMRAALLGSVLAAVSGGTAAAECPIIRTDQHGFDPRCSTNDGRSGNYHCMKGNTNCDNSGCYSDSDSQFVCVPEQPVSETDYVIPKFVLVTVAYAPPGTKDCTSRSTARYGEENQLGVTVSASHTAKQETKVSVGISAKTPATSGEASVSFSYTGSQKKRDEMVITKAESSAISIESPCVDGLDHNWDQIYMILSPEIQVDSATAAGCVGCGETMSWTVLENTGIPFRVYVGELNGAFEMQRATMDSFQAHDINSEDIQKMLEADPLATSGFLDEQRFVRVNATLPYVPVIEGGSDAGADHGMTSAEKLQSGYESTYEYGVGFKVSGEGGLGPIFSVKLAAEFNWTWTNTNSTAFDNMNTTSASLHVASPSADYQGPYAIAIYYDTIFKTYAFVPVN